jgi:hypothetical protein
VRTKKKKKNTVSFDSDSSNQFDSCRGSQHLENFWLKQKLWDDCLNSNNSFLLLFKKRRLRFTLLCFNQRTIIARMNSTCSSHSRAMPRQSFEKPDNNAAAAATNSTLSSSSSSMSSNAIHGPLQQHSSRRRQRWFGQSQRGRRRNSTGGTTVDDDDSANDSMSSSSSLETCEEVVENEIQEKSTGTTVGSAITSTKSLWNDSMSYSDSDVSFSQSVRNSSLAAVSVLSLHRDTAQHSEDEDDNDDDSAASFSTNSSSLYSNDRYFLTTEDAPPSSCLVAQHPPTNANSVASICGGYSIGSGNSSTGGDNYIFCDDDDDDDDHSQSSSSDSSSEHASTKQPFSSTKSTTLHHCNADQRGRILAQKIVEQAHYMHHQKLSSSTTTTTTTPRFLLGRMRQKLFTKSTSPLDQYPRDNHHYSKNPHRISTLAFSAAAEQHHSSDVRNRIIGFEDWEARVADKNKTETTPSSPGFLVTSSSSSSSSSACSSNESVDSTITHHSASTNNHGNNNPVPTTVHSTTASRDPCWRKYRDGLEEPRPTAEQVADRLGIHEQGRKALEKLRGRVGIIEELEISTTGNSKIPPPPPAGLLPWIRIIDDDNQDENEESTTTTTSESHWIPHYEEYVIRAVHHLAQRIFYNMATPTTGSSPQFAP